MNRTQLPRAREPLPPMTSWRPRRSGAAGRYLLSVAAGALAVLVILAAIGAAHV